MSEGVNPNVDTANSVDNQESIEVRGGENFTSFDDMERAVSNKSAKSRKVEKESSDPVERKDKAEKSEKKEAKESKAKEEDGDDEKVTLKQAAEKKKAENAEKARVKKILAKLKKEDGGEDDVELDPGLMLKHKVAGKDVDVSLTDLLNEFSGKTDWTRKYTDLDKEKRDFSSQRDKLNNNVRKFHELAQNDPQEALEFIFETYGQDSRSVMKGIQEKWLEKYSNYSEMDETERRAAELEEEKTYYQKKYERTEQEKAQHLKLQEVNTQIQNAKEQYKISDDDFMKAYRELAASPDVARATRQNPEFELTPTHVARYYEISSMRNTVEDTIREIRPELAEKMHEIHSEVDYIRSRNPDFSKEDISEILRSVYAPKKKLPASIKERVTGQRIVNEEVKSTKRPIVSFADLMD